MRNKSSLSAIGIKKPYIDGDDNVLSVLCSVDIFVFSGEVLGLVGINGSGKTTLLNILSGMREWSSGRILLDGREWIVVT